MNVIPWSLYLFFQPWTRTVTTDKPVSDKTPTHARTHTENGMETLPEALKRSTEQRQPPENLHIATIEKTERGEELGPSPEALRPSQNTIPFTTSLPLFYSPRREVVTIFHIIFILCPFGQRYASISFPLNALSLWFHLSRLVPIYVHYNKTCAPM